MYVPEVFRMSWYNYLRPTFSVAFQLSADFSLGQVLEPGLAASSVGVGRVSRYRDSQGADYDWPATGRHR